MWMYGTDSILHTSRSSNGVSVMLNSHQKTRHFFFFLQVKKYNFETFVYQRYKNKILFKVLAEMLIKSNWDTMYPITFQGNKAEYIKTDQNIPFV